jgi:hypothetical protein
LILEGVIQVLQSFDGGEIDILVKKKKAGRTPWRKVGY